MLEVQQDLAAISEQLATGMAEYERVEAEAFELLKRGGWLEMERIVRSSNFCVLVFAGMVSVGRPRWHRRVHRAAPHEALVESSLSTRLELRRVERPERFVDLSLCVFSLFRREVPLRHLNAGVAQPMLYRADIYAAPQSPSGERV